LQAQNSTHTAPTPRSAGQKPEVVAVTPTCPREGHSEAGMATVLGAAAGISLLMKPMPGTVNVQEELVRSDYSKTNHVVEPLHYFKR